MTSAPWPVMLAIIVNAITFHALPRFSRPDILFAVTVSEAFAAGDGRTLLSRYRAIVWIGAAAALAITLLLPSAGGGRLTFGAVAGNMLVAGSAWLWAHRQTLAHAVAPPAVRVASLVPRDTSLPGGTAFAAAPLAILLATALVVYAYRAELPDGGRLRGLLGFLAFGAVSVAMLLTMAVSLARRSRQVAVDGPAAAAEQRFRRVNVLLPLVIAHAAAISLSAVTIGSIPRFGGILSGSAGFVWMAVALLEIGGVIWLFRVGQGGQRAVAPAARREVHGDGTPDAAWKAGGLWYFNPRDPAMWVENRIGFGYTLNVGNWRAWLLMIGMMLAPMVASRLLF